MKKLFRKLFKKKKKGLLSIKVRFIYDPRLDSLDLESLAPEKLAEANFHLSKMKSLPK